MNTLKHEAMKAFVLSTLKNSPPRYGPDPASQNKVNHKYVATREILATLRSYNGRSALVAVPALMRKIADKPFAKKDPKYRNKLLNLAFKIERIHKRNYDESIIYEKLDEIALDIIGM